MLRKTDCKLKPNPLSLALLTKDPDFWKGLSISEIWKLLLRALTFKDGLTALPDHDDLKGLLKVISERLQSFATKELLTSCKKFVAHVCRSDTDDGQFYLQLIAIVHFYRGHYAQAAKYAGLLADAYFISGVLETDFLSAHFNKLAGIACQLDGDTQKACHYYNQYVMHTINAKHSPEEVLAATQYLLEHNALVVTRDTLTHLHRMSEAVMPNLALKLEYEILTKKVKKMKPVSNQPPYDVLVAGAKANLTQTTHDILDKQLQILEQARFYALNIGEVNKEIDPQALQKFRR
jgi:hypothetical protein